MVLPEAMSKLSLVLSAGLVAAAVAVQLHRPPPTQQALDLVGMIDRDDDGRLSPEEVARVDDGELPFTVLDVDSSGALDPWEVDLLLRHLSPIRGGAGALPRVR